MRVVVVDGALTLDSYGRLPGRGAHVHPDTHCLELAARRRAFARALRGPGVLDVGPIVAALVEQGRILGTVQSHPSDTEAGREQ